MKHLTDEAILEMATEKLNISQPNPDKIMEIAELLGLELDPENDRYLNPNYFEVIASEKSAPYVKNRVVTFKESAFSSKQLEEEMVKIKSDPYYFYKTYVSFTDKDGNELPKLSRKEFMAEREMAEKASKNPYLTRGRKGNIL